MHNKQIHILRILKGFWFLTQGTWPLVSCQWVAKMVVVEHNNSFEIQAVHNEFPFLRLLANEANLNADPT